MFRYNLLVVLIVLLGALSSAVANESPAILNVGAPVLTLAVSPSNVHLGFGGLGGTVGVVDTATFVERWRADVYSPDAHIMGVGFVRRSDEEIVVAGSQDTTIRFFSARDGTFLYRPPELEPLDGEMAFAVPGPHLAPNKRAAAARAHKRRYPLISSMAVAPNGHWLAYICGDHILVQWDTRFWRKGERGAESYNSFGQQIQLIDGVKRHTYMGLGPVTISIDGQYVISGGQLCTIYRVRDLALLSRFDAPNEKARAITALACRPQVEGLEVALANRDGHVVLCQINTAVEPLAYWADTKVMQFPTGVRLSKAVRSQTTKAPPEAMAAQQPFNAPRSQRIFTVSSLGRAHENFAEDLVFTPDGQYLISAGSALVANNAPALATRPDLCYDGPMPDKNCLRIWEVETGRLVGELGDGKTSALALALSPDGQTLYAGFEDGTIRRWPMPTTGERVARVPFKQ